MNITIRKPNRLQAGVLLLYVALAILAAFSHELLIILATLAVFVFIHEAIHFFVAKRYGWQIKAILVNALWIGVRTDHKGLYEERNRRNFELAIIALSPWPLVLPFAIFLSVSIGLIGGTVLSWIIVLSLSSVGDIFGLLQRWKKLRGAKSAKEYKARLESLNKAADEEARSSLIVVDLGGQQ